MKNILKKKKYLVEVRSSTSAKMIVFANSKLEAYQIADKDMSESMDKMIRNAKPHEFVSELRGYGEAMKSSVELLKD